MYKVLNNEGEKIVVKTIDPKIHFHLSGREFNESDACVKFKVKAINEIREELVRPEEVKEMPWAVEYRAKKLEKQEYSREEAIEAFKEKHGRKPSSKMKTENIIAKL